MRRWFPLVLLLFAHQVSAQQFELYKPKAQSEEAQFDVSAAVVEWSKKTGQVALPSVVEELKKTLGAQYKMQGGTLKNVSTISQTGKITVAKDCLDCASPSWTVTLLSKLFSADNVGSVLEAYPLLTVVVVPDPPRDYKLTVNGRVMQVSPNGFRVPEGPWNAKAERGQKNCAKSGTMKKGETAEFSCTL